MAITYNLENDIRYNQGLEKGMQQGMQQGLQKGLEEGAQRATRERNIAFVHCLLANTDHTVEEIANLVNVPVDFVNQLKK